jgi:hypothetical protein
VTRLVSTFTEMRGSSRDLFPQNTVAVAVHQHAHYGGQVRGYVSCCDGARCWGCSVDVGSSYALLLDGLEVVVELVDEGNRGGDVEVCNHVLRADVSICRKWRVLRE